MGRGLKEEDMSRRDTEEGAGERRRRRELEEEEEGVFEHIKATGLIFSCNLRVMSGHTCCDHFTAMTLIYCV